jgi:hypothetical protein
MPPFGKRGYLWVTLALFLVSLSGQFVFSWFLYVQEQQEHGSAVEVGDYLVSTFKDVLENWQSEFLQLLWQVGGLSFLWYVGSPDSKEGDERKEEKLDRILEKVLGAKEAEQVKKELEQRYPKK